MTGNTVSGTIETLIGSIKYEAKLINLHPSNLEIVGLEWIQEKQLIPFVNWEI